MADCFHLLVGSETGLFKGINLTAKSWCNVNKPSTNDRQSVLKERQITQLCWCDESHESACLGLINHTVCVYDVAKKDFVKTLFLRDNDADDTTALVGLATAGSSERVITCSSAGNVRVWSTTSETPDCTAQIAAGANIERMRNDHNAPNMIATGGQKNDLKLWDINNPSQPVFRAKNVRNDFLDLEVPIWVTDMAFLADSRRIATCTNHHQVRVYAPQQQRRPVADIDWGEHPLKALALHPNGQQLVVGSACGDMALVDLRGKAYIAAKYKGGAGSIRSIACHATAPLVASCGLDRYVRVHDVNTRQLTQKFYMKSRLNCLLFTAQSLKAGAATDSVDDVTMSDDETRNVDDNEDVDDDKLWEQLETVASTTKRKRKNLDNNNVDSAQKQSKQKSKKKSA